MKRAARASGTQKATGNVDIETTLVRYRSWSAHFPPSGRRAPYAMKGISDFVERMRAGEFFSYGKKLAFLHSRPSSPSTPGASRSSSTAPWPCASRRARRRTGATAPRAWLGAT